MSVTQILFYVLAGVIAASTGLAVFQRQPVHAVVYLVVSFFATAVLFGLFGAPLPAILQIMVPAGAVMVLFLFIIMLLGREEPKPRDLATMRWIGPAALAAVAAVAGAVLLSLPVHEAVPMAMAKASAKELGRFVYQNYWPAVEAVSVLFFVALAGAMFLVRDFKARGAEKPGNEEAQP
ncbi:NADH-quinone oxidoreductase subunit J family protein [Fundidesulfovibrio terrae]|uniref:NADH-quinone oxidoreductase subunit J family protein n=1 Tax=Fundidesulfovibrio terrae TaxID=2922866 RepID=UPI001FAE9A9F|nr:NADH-quinone oxidoreductase subunit J [Fundidesulfovibrio terrae]